MNQQKVSIGFFETRSDDEKRLTEKFQTEAIEADLYFSKEIIDKDHLPENKNFSIISIFVNSTITREVMEALPSLKFISVRATGYDNVDLEAAKEKGIKVSNVPSYGEHTVAEFTFGLILNLSRKIYQAVDQIREIGNWKVENLTGFDLHSKTLGIVGTGRIGRHVAKIAKGFEMKILSYDTHPDEPLSKEYGLQYVSLSELLNKSDIVTLHVPYMKETHHLLGEKEFSQIKVGAYLVNTSRGAIVDTNALFKALQEKRLAGAALDVLEEEGVVKDEMGFIFSGKSEEHDIKTILSNHILIDMPGVLITPHNAFNSKEAFERISDTTVSNIKSFTEGNLVNEVKT